MLILFTALLSRKRRSSSSFTNNTTGSVRSRYHGCLEKAINITYLCVCVRVRACECALVALFIQLAAGMRHIVTLFVALLALHYFWTFCHESA